MTFQDYIKQRTFELVKQLNNRLEQLKIYKNNHKELKDDEIKLINDIIKDYEDQLKGFEKLNQKAEA